MNEGEWKKANIRFAWQDFTLERAEKPLLTHHAAIYIYFYLF
jgi:hypothetical protein